MSQLTRAQHSIRRLLVIGGGAIALLAGGGGVWAATTSIAGAIVAHGSIVVDSAVKNVQHPRGGIVSELNVRDGQHVSAGEVVARLDATMAQAALGMVTNAIRELLARQARLEAERDASAAIAFPDELLALAADPDVAGMMAGEERLMQSRAMFREHQKTQLWEQISQAEQEIRGLEAQLEAVGRQLTSLDGERMAVASLRKDALVTANRVSDLERRIAELEGSRGQMVSSTAMIRARISERRSQILQIDEELESQASGELREIDAQLGELFEKQITANDELQRMAVRAPQTGYVHQLAVHTVGGVIGAGDIMMLVVPDNDELIVEVRVAPQDVDQLSPGQPVVVRFSAFNLRTTPDLAGTVMQVSADQIRDAQAGQVYYLARIRLQSSETDKLGDLVLLPGMPAEVFIKTRDRTVLDYFLQPLGDQVARAFREE